MEISPEFEHVGKCTNVTLRTNIIENDTLIFCFENNQLTLTAEMECCSQSWFEELDGHSFQELKGKTILCLKCDTRQIEMSPSGFDEVDVNHVNELYIQNDDGSSTTFQFVMRNSSNGYYDGYITKQWWLNAHTDTRIPTEAHLIVVVGLPCCGKTTYVKNNYDLNKYTFFDDFLNDPKNSMEIMKLLVLGKQVIVADPRLCNKNVFEKEIITTFTQGLHLFSGTISEIDKNKLCNKYQLTVIEFKQNAFQSVLNALEREQNKPTAMTYIRSIVNIDNAHNLHPIKSYRYHKWLEIDTYRASTNIT